jgi:hypothetical protein
VELFFWAALRSAVEEAHAAADGGPVGLRGVRAAGRRLAGPGAGPRRCASRAREVLAYCRGVLARRPGDAAADCIALDLDG